MQTIVEKTVREIALEKPSAIRVFESVGIDYCCGGKRPLSEACARVGVSIEEVENLIEKAERDSRVPGAEEWNEKPLRELIAQIVAKHHAYVRQESPRIEGLLAKVASRHGPTRPEIAQIGHLFLAIAQELATHMHKEEQVLFPYVERMEQAVSAHMAVPAGFFGAVTNPIANMLAEHEDAGALLARIRALSDGYTAPTGACPTYLALYRSLDEFERDLHHHIHLENNILFPRAIAMETTHAD